MNNPDIKYKKFSVIGAARSGIAVSRLLHSNNYYVFLSDKAKENKISKNDLEKIKKMNIEFEFGKNSDKIYENDAMIVSPGIPQNSEIFRKAKEKNIPVFSEIEAAYWFSKGKIIGITGTNGKTTTTTLTGNLFKEAGFDVYVCGNIGTAFSDIIEYLKDDSVSVIEVSSFQLDNIKYFKPDVSVMMNVTPDHLDRYDNVFENYINSKFRIISNQDYSSWFVFNFDDNVITERINEIKNVQLIPFSIKTDISDKFNISCYLKDNSIIVNKNGKQEKIIDIRELIIKGPHNVYNSMASLLSTEYFSITREVSSNVLRTFEGVEHRIEFVRELNGIKFYNDSKATNVDSIWYALQGFNEPIVLILGGRDKGNDYSILTEKIRNNVKKIIAVGESKNKVYDFFNNIRPVELSEDMQDCVNKAYRSAEKGDIVLLSPACASFDMFNNYEHRGNEFKRLVLSLKNEL